MVILINFRDESEILSGPHEVIENMNYVIMPAIPKLNSNLAQLGSVEELIQTYK